jgi:hypothetical protein
VGNIAPGSREHLNRPKPRLSVSPVLPVLPVVRGLSAGGLLSQTCRPSIFCCAKMGFRSLLGHSRRTPLRHVNDQEHDSNHE